MLLPPWLWTLGKTSRNDDYGQTAVNSDGLTKGLDSILCVSPNSEHWNSSPEPKWITAAHPSLLLWGRIRLLGKAGPCLNPAMSVRTPVRHQQSTSSRIWCLDRGDVHEWAWTFCTQYQHVTTGWRTWTVLVFATTTNLQLSVWMLDVNISSISSPIAAIRQEDDIKEHSCVSMFVH